MSDQPSEAAVQKAAAKRARREQEAHEARLDRRYALVAAAHSSGSLKPDALIKKAEALLLWLKQGPDDDA